MGLGELLSALFTNIIAPIAVSTATTAIQGAMAPSPPKPMPTGGPGPIGAGGAGIPAGANPGAFGSGSAVRPGSMNFAGGFTGAPPGAPSGPVGGATPTPGAGGFSSLDRVRQPGQNNFLGGI